MDKAFNIFYNNKQTGREQFKLNENKVYVLRIRKRI